MGLSKTASFQAVLVYSPPQLVGGAEKQPEGHNLAKCAAEEVLKDIWANKMTNTHMQNRELGIAAGAAAALARWAEVICIWCGQD